MRIYELICEDIEQEVDQSLKQMFIPYLAQGQEKVSMDHVLDHMRSLHGSDWDVSPEWVMQTLDGASFIKRVTPEDVYLNTHTPSSLTTPNQQEKSQDHVSQMAKKAINK